MLSVTTLQADEIDRVDAALPLNRLDTHLESDSTYLIAWKDDEPVGHAHVAWSGTKLGVPEIQDVFVLSAHRRLGVATALNDAAEAEARARGECTISLSVSLDGNAPARRLYERLGYRDAGIDPVRVSGVIQLRGAPFEVDDTLLYLVKAL